MKGNKLYLKLVCDLGEIFSHDQIELLVYSTESDERLRLLCLKEFDLSKVETYNWSGLVYKVVPNLNLSSGLALVKDDPDELGNFDVVTKTAAHFSQELSLEQVEVLKAEVVPSLNKALRSQVLVQSDKRAKQIKITSPLSIYQPADAHVESIIGLVSELDKKVPLDIELKIDYDKRFVRLGIWYMRGVSPGLQLTQSLVETLAENSLGIDMQAYEIY